MQDLRYEFDINTNLYESDEKLKDIIKEYKL